VLDARVLVDVLGVFKPPGSSTSDESGVVGLDAKDGRSSDFREGDGGSGVGGLL
jgi:hypothetical protein